MIKRLLRKWQVFVLGRLSRKPFSDECVKVPAGPPRIGGEIVGSPIYGEADHLCSMPTKGNVE